MIEKHNQCHGKLSFSLLGYRTTVCISTGATPYMLVYGTEVVVPTEVEIPSLRIIHEAELDDTEWVKSRYEQLALIYGKRMNTVCHGQLYQNRMSKAFNKRAKPRQFTLVQLVLKKIFPHQDEAKGEFSPNWQGTDGAAGADSISVSSGISSADSILATFFSIYPPISLKPAISASSSPVLLTPQ
ncbi:uncharacterized protein [Nicotiana sylvestris]|uniref:uncharacterized protein n=1 Tax=Nicotiana sylvestris TaxID=4096 RepID=UPI00388C93F3